MNRRKALLGLAAGSAVAGPSILYAQNAGVSPGGRGSLTAFLLNTAGAVVGTFNIQRFAAINDQLHAIGVVTATDGVKTAVSALAVPVTPTVATLAAQQASCPILHLAIGPINLNLLGLIVTTQPIVVDIVAQPGPGNLLGNLLCAIAGLLNPGGTVAGLLQQLVGLLNQLLASLG